ncbi:hypothetical protein ABKW28_18510 [Nocardioides sp. 31GB23]|uniref:hypothetical protein n=1 Tax=Nocardioides sp. 31GB23 TaxID=3156065 RepID=UPI0032AEFEDA
MTFACHTATDGDAFVSGTATVSACAKVRERSSTSLASARAISANASAVAGWLIAHSGVSATSSNAECTRATTRFTG